MSYSVLRRYTPPTCTLEILAKNSPLSRWAGQPVLKNLRFQLSLDDPTLANDRWVALRGDREQLEALAETVQGYVQTLLEQSHDRLTAMQLEASPVSVASPEAAITPLNSCGISLQPKGMLAHELTLGTLQTIATGETVPLSTLQLFDLANALDDYAIDGLALPTLPKQNWLVASPAWAKIAAAALLLVGVSASIVKVLDAPASTASKSGTPTSSQGASSNDQRIATQLPPTATPGSSLPPSSPKPLPTPPPLGNTSAPPTTGFPNSGASPNSSASSNAGLPTENAPQRGSAANPNAPDVTVEQNRPPSDSTIVVPGSPTVQGEPRSTQTGSQPSIALNPEAPTGGSSTTERSRRPASAADLAPTAKANSSEAARPSDTGSIPQVDEARQYFQQRWTPPKALERSVEYLVGVDEKGAVKSISALGETAGLFLDRTQIPHVGEPLVSPLKSGRTSATFRLVFNPDGSVQTFLSQ